MATTNRYHKYCEHTGHRLQINISRSKNEYFLWLKKKLLYQGKNKQSYRASEENIQEVISSAY